MQDKPLPALLRAKVGIQDEITFTLTRTVRVGYVVKADFESDFRPIKIYFTEEEAKAMSLGKEVVKIRMNLE